MLASVLLAGGCPGTIAAGKPTSAQRARIVCVLQLAVTSRYVAHSRQQAHPLMRVVCIWCGLCGCTWGVCMHGIGKRKKANVHTNRRLRSNKEICMGRAPSRRRLALVQIVTQGVWGFPRAREQCAGPPGEGAARSLYAARAARTPGGTKRGRFGFLGRWPAKARTCCNYAYGRTHALKCERVTVPSRTSHPGSSPRIPAPGNSWLLHLLNTRARAKGKM